MYKTIEKPNSQNPTAHPGCQYVRSVPKHITFYYGD